MIEIRKSGTLFEILDLPTINDVYQSRTVGLFMTLEDMVELSEKLKEVGF